MVTRTNVFGVAVQLLRRSSSLRLVAAGATLCLGLSMAAQQPSGEPPTGEPPTGQAPVGQAPASPAAAEAPKLGRVLTDSVVLRCWPGTAATPPLFEDVLVKDQVVAVGRSENGFRAVMLPLGPIGYVSRKFTDVAVDGTVKSKGSKVAFRYRPRSTEAPVAQLEPGTVLHVVAEQPDWYQVRVPSIEAWVAEAEVQVGDPADPALVAGYAELKSKQEMQIQARLDQLAAALKLEEQNKADLAAVQVVQDAFTAELAKPVAEQKFASLTEALDKLGSTLTAESAGKSAIESLRKRIETQSWIAEASALRNEKPVPVADPMTSDPKDQLDRFQSIGWLRYESRLGAPGLYYLEKGGRRQYMVSCTSNRYDLALFVDREVGVLGPRRRPATESLSVLDVERLEVLGTRAK